MDSGRARALLLLLLLLTTGWAHAAGTEGADGARSWHGDQVFAVSQRPCPPLAAGPGALASRVRMLTSPHNRALAAPSPHAALPGQGPCPLSFPAAADPRRKSGPCPRRTPRRWGPSCASCCRPRAGGAQPSCSSRSGEWGREGESSGWKDAARAEALADSLPRFGRASRGPWSQDRLSARTGEGPGSPFWSLIAPQRFGKK